MPSNDYLFVTQWQLPGTPEEISDILGDTALLARIWPSVYGGARIVEPGDEHGVGQVVELETRGHLPYTLRWAFRVVASRRPYGYTIESWGDLAGRGVWTIEPDGAWTNLTYDWRVRAEKPFLRWFSPILKQLFKMNHDRVMADGEAALCDELERRHASGQQAPS